MTQGAARAVVRESPREAWAPRGRLILGSRRFWLVLVAVAVVAAAALLTLLPCTAMCALHLCASKSAGSSCTGEHQGAESGRAP